MQNSNQLPSNESPHSFEYKYIGRLVTRERPIIRKSKSLHQNLVFPSNTNKYSHSTLSHRREESVSSDDDLSKPLGVIRINDRHFREIYRIPTPPPQVKRVFHRLRSPKPKIIERVFVRRSAPEIIENIIEVPPEKVRIINREKYLEKSKPIIRTKVIHLKPHQSEEQQQQTFIPTERYSQQQPTTLIHPPQVHPHRIGYNQSKIPPQSSNWQPVQATCYTYEPQQRSSNSFSGYSRY